MNLNDYCKKKRMIKNLKIFDYFGSQIQFRINKDDQFRSIFGGVIFLIYFIFAFTYLLYNFYQFASRKVLNLSFSQKKISPAPELSVLNLNFSLALRYANRDYDPIALKDTMEFLNYEIHFMELKNNKFQNAIKIPTKICTKENFPNVSQTLFAANQLNYTLCPDLKIINGKLIKGMITDEYSNYIHISINIKSEFRDKLTEIKKFFTSNLYFFNLYIMDTQVDYTNYSKPFGTYLNSFEMFLDYFKAPFVKINMGKIQFISDNNILWPEQQEESEVVLASTEILDITNSRINNNLNIADLFIKSSPEVIVYERTYQKLNDFLANMTGILSQVVIILYIIVHFVNEKKLQHKILNKIFKYGDSRRLNNELLHTTFSKYLPNFSLSINHEETTTNKKLSNSYKKSSKLNESIQSKTSNTSLLSKPEQQKNKINSFILLISFVVCCKRQKQYIEKLEYVENKMNYCLDFITYLKTLEDLKLLKSIILSEDQHKIFNFVAYPNLKQSIQHESKIFKFQKDEIESLYLSFENIYVDKSTVNTKLVNSLINELESLK